MKVGLVLQGGGLRGVYTAGVLDTFLDNNIKVDGIIGVSAGVLFGADYVSKQRGRTIRYLKKYVNDKRYMGIRSYIRTGNLVNSDFAYSEVPKKLDIFNEEEFEKSKIDFYATVTNVKTGKAEYIKLKNILEQTELLRATSALPIISKIVNFENEEYLDGGIADNIPIDKCIDLGYEKIIVILTRPINYRKVKSNNLIIRLKYKKYPNLVKAINNRYLDYNKSIEKVINLKNNQQIFVISPSQTLKMKRMEKNIQKLNEMYELGVKDCNDNLSNLLNYINN